MVLFTWSLLALDLLVGIFPAVDPGAITSKPVGDDDGLGRKSMSRVGGCVFDLDKESPQFPPHLIDPDKLEIIQPILVDKKRIVNLVTGQRVTVACQGPGKNSNVLTATDSAVSIASCLAPSSLLIGDRNLSYASLGCKSQVKETFKEMGTCSTTGTRILIGWEVDKQFINQLSVCHDRGTANTLYSSSTIRGSSILADDESNTRPAFRKGAYFNGIDVDKAYTQSAQKVMLATLLGTDRYFDVPKGFYFARGHLAPDGDFVDAASQDATYYYINAAPQWQSFNNGNWKALETAVRNLAAARKADYTIYTGTHGILSLPDVKGVSKDVYLTVDSNNNGVIPVPKFYWKVVHDPEAKKATAFVGINHPWIDLKTDTGAIICPDVCSQVPWVTFQRTRIPSGYTYCCSVAELSRVVPHAPKLDDLPLLD